MQTGWVGHSQISAHHISAETGRIFMSMFISLSNSDRGAVPTLTQPNPHQSRVVTICSLNLSHLTYLHISLFTVKKRLVYLSLLNSALFPIPPLAAWIVLFVSHALLLKCSLLVFCTVISVVDVSSALWPLNYTAGRMYRIRVCCPFMTRLVHLKLFYLILFSNLSWVYWHNPHLVILLLTENVHNVCQKFHWIENENSVII